MILLLEDTALVLAQRDAKFISDRCERIVGPADQPGTTHVEPNPWRDLPGERAPTDALGSLYQRAGKSQPCKFLGSGQTG